QTAEPLTTAERTALRHGRAVDGSLSIGGVDYFFAARRISGSKEPLVLLRPKSATSDRWTPYVYSLLLAAGVGGLLAALVAFLLARRIARPVRQVAEASRSLARGEHPEPVPGGRATERSFLLSVSHELKTPLTAIRGYAEAIEDGAIDAREAAATVAQESARL